MVNHDGASGGGHIGDASGGGTRGGASYSGAQGDYKSGWQMNKEWDEKEKARKRSLAMKGGDDDEGEGGEEEEDEDEEGLPFACFICRQSFVDPVVTKFKHYFCEHCALKIVNIFTIIWGTISPVGNLRALEGAAKRLILCKADLLDCEAIQGCVVVFHTASPITDDPEQMVEPTVKGTKYVIDAAADAGVRRVVFTSSIGAVAMDPNRGPSVVVDESCWSDLDFCEKTKNWYCYGKVVVEQAAWETARNRGLELVVVCPVLVIWPMLQTGINASTAHILKYLDGFVRSYANAV